MPGHERSPSASRASADATATATAEGVDPPQEDDRFDVVVIGGGIVGSGIARDAALRGLRVALVEKNDHGWGTTARSTRLAHGGLRYLEHYDFSLVREALRERRVLIENAPHLVGPLPFLLPVIRGRGRPRWMLRLGLWLYDTLARRNIGTPHAWWPRDRVVRLEPLLDRPDLLGAFLYYDAQVSYPERLVVENVVDLQRLGGVALNHTEALRLEPSSQEDPAQERIVVCRDAITGEERRLHAKVVVNAGGPWVTEVDSRLGSSAPALTRRTKGVHLLTRRLTHHAMLIQSADGERVFFVIPWQGRSLIGTTDTDYGGANEAVKAETEDVRYLLDEVNENLAIELGPEDIQDTYAGLRSLIHETGGTTGAVSRRHLVVDHGVRDGIHGLVTVVGGKITAFRAIAEDVVDQLLGLLDAGPGAGPGAGRAAATDRRGAWAGRRDSTASRPLPGGAQYDPVALRRRLGALLPHHTDDDVERLFALYGARVDELLDIAEPVVARDAAGLRERGAPQGERPHIVGHIHPRHRLSWEEVLFVVMTEGARTIPDILLRRTMVGYDVGNGLELLPALEEGLVQRFGWDAAAVADQARDHRETVERNHEAVAALTGSYTPKRADPRLGKRNRRPPAKVSS